MVRYYFSEIEEIFNTALMAWLSEKRQKYKIHLSVDSTWDM